MKQQVNKDHYDLSKYSTVERWGSYYYQLKEVLALKPQEILEVGVGDKVFGNYIKSNSSIKYTSVDIAADLGPDFVGNLDRLPFPDRSYDVVCAFEVLEHLPFEKFEESLKEMKRVSKKFVVMSLPHFGPPIQINFKIPLMPRVKFAFKLPFPKKHVFKGEHFWEIGKKNYPLSRTCKVLERHFKLLKHFVPFENQYHHFFVLQIHSE